MVLIRLHDSEFHPRLISLNSGKMNEDDSETSSDSEEEPDDPYIHTVSTEEFVETVEKASHEEPGRLLATNEE